MLWLLLSLAIFGTISVSSSDVNASEAVSDFVRGNRLFSANMYKEIIKEKKGNFIMSPFSAEIVLALTNEGAFGETSEELHKGLSLPKTKEATQEAVKDLLPKLRKAEKDLKLLTANKIYASKNIKVNPGFNDIAKSVYNAGLENVDFAEKEQTVKTINHWVEEQTNDKIHDLILPSFITANTQLILVNALYFSGKWINPFKKYATGKDKFFKTNKDTSEVDMMQQTHSFKYYDNKTLNTRFLELPYQGEDISLIIALPNEVDGLSKLEEKIEELLEPQSLVYQRVDLKLPKFKIETQTQLQPVLEQMGIKKMFTKNANLTGLITSEESLFVDSVVQKAFVDVNEEGTEAAAATAVITAFGSSFMPEPEPVKFYADHPFLFYIQQNNVVLFVGKYA